MEICYFEGIVANECFMGNSWMEEDRLENGWDTEGGWRWGVVYFFVGVYIFFVIEIDIKLYGGCYLIGFFVTFILRLWHNLDFL